MLSRPTAGQAPIGIERVELRIVLVSTAAAFYVGTFLPLYDALGPGIVSLSSVPVALAGWLFGLRAGLLGGVLAFAVNTALLGLQNSTDVHGFVWGGAVSGSASLMVGAVAGALRDMTDRLGEQIQTQSIETPAPAAQQIDLTAAVAGLPAAFMVVAPDATLLYSNNAIAGMAPDAVRGMKVLNFVPRQHHELFMNTLDRVFRTGQPAGYQVADTAGAPTLHIIRLAPLMKGGLFAGVVLLSLDVSDDQD